MTDRTREVDTKNYKPYRTKEQKLEARRLAVKCSDGAWRSTANVSYHHRKVGKGP